MSFKKPNTEPSRQIYLLIEGPENSRKTTLGLQAPGSLGVLDLNKGLDIPEFYEEQKKKDIEISTIPRITGDGDERRQHAQEAKDIFMRDVLESLEENPYTLVDTGTNVWEIVRLADMGALTVKGLDTDARKRGQLNYDAPNATMREWLYYPYETGNSLIITAHLGEWEGNIYPRGFKEIPEIVRHHVRLDKDFNCEVLKCRSNHEAVGKTLECPSFLDLALLFYPETEPEDWQ